MRTIKFTIIALCFVFCFGSLLRTSKMGLQPAADDFTTLNGRIIYFKGATTAHNGRFIARSASNRPFSMTENEANVIGRDDMKWKIRYSNGYYLFENMKNRNYYLQATNDPTYPLKIVQSSYPFSNNSLKFTLSGTFDNFAIQCFTQQKYLFVKADFEFGLRKNPDTNARSRFKIYIPNISVRTELIQKYYNMEPVVLTHKFTYEVGIDGAENFPASKCIK